MSTFNFKIATPDRVVYHDDIDQVTIPTAAGEITVLPDHAPLVSVLKPGELRIVKDGQTIPLVSDRGVLEIRSDSTVIILADVSERAEDIDVDAAQGAYDRIKAYLEEKNDVTDVEFARMQAILETNMVRLKVARKWRK